MKKLIVVVLTLLAVNSNAAVLCQSPNGGLPYAPATLAVAATSTSCKNTDVVVTTPQVVTTAISWPTDRELKFEKGGYVTFTGSGALTGLKEARPEWFGFNSSPGTTDMSSAIQNALRSMNKGGTLKLSPNTIYSIRTSIYADMSEFDADWIIEGGGQSTVLQATGLGAGYMIYLNETSGGVEATGADTYPGMRFKLRNFTVKATETTSSTTSFAKGNQCGIEMTDIRFDYVKYGLRTTGYCDLVKVARNEVVHTVTDGYLYYQATAGDGLVFEQNTMTPYGTWSGMLFARGVKNGQVRNNIQGSYHMRSCGSVDFVNNHIETIHGAGAKVEILNSVVNLRSNTIYNFIHPTLDVAGDTDNYPVKIDDVTATDAVYPSSTITLSDNRFVIAEFDTTTKRTKNDIYIVPASRTQLTLRNNVASLYDGLLTFYDFGISVGSSNAALQTDLSLKSSLLSGNVVIGRTGNSTHYVLNTDKLNEFSIPASAQPVIYGGGRVNTQPLGSFSDGTTYYYRVGSLTLIGETTATTEVGYVATGGLTGAIQLTLLNPVPNSTLRVWRGTSAGVYDSYADIPAVTGDTRLWDRGDNIQGVPWVSSAIPAIPSATTSFRGRYVNGAKYLFHTAMPTTGSWTVGDTVLQTDAAIVGSGGYVTANQKYIVYGWYRITTGSNNALDTDWVEMRTLTGQ